MSCKVSSPSRPVKIGQPKTAPGYCCSENVPGGPWSRLATPPVPDLLQMMGGLLEP